jgi:hypothetical protein
MNYRNKKYLDWLRDQPCITCGRPSNFGDKNQASHVGVSNFRSKPPDDQAISQCGRCHTLFEYHSNKFVEITGISLPSLDDCEFYFQQYLLERKLEDPRVNSERTPDQD